MDDGICLNCAAPPCQSRGQDAGLLRGHPTWVLFPGVACALNEAHGHQQNEYGPGISADGAQSCQKVISWF